VRHGQASGHRVIYRPLFCLEPASPDGTCTAQSAVGPSCGTLTWSVSNSPLFIDGVVPSCHAILHHTVWPHVCIILLLTQPKGGVPIRKPEALRAAALRERTVLARTATSLLAEALQAKGNQGFAGIRTAILVVDNGRNGRPKNRT